MCCVQFLAWKIKIVFRIACFLHFLSWLLPSFVPKFMVYNPIFMAWLDINVSEADASESLDVNDALSMVMDSLKIKSYH